MISLLIIWFLQDFIQVFLMGFFIVPDVFLIFLLMTVLLPDVKKDKQIMLIWVAFLGGLMWDFRWTNLPGLTAAINGASVALSCYIWQKIPSQGRSAVFFAFIAFTAILLSGSIHFLFWAVPSQVAVRQFMVQQFIGVPVVILFALMFRKASDRNV